MNCPGFADGKLGVHGGCRALFMSLNSAGVDAQDGTCGDGMDKGSINTYGGKTGTPC